MADRGNGRWEEKDDDAEEGDDADSEVLRWSCRRDELLMGMEAAGEEEAVL